MIKGMEGVQYKDMSEQIRTLQPWKKRLMRGKAGDEIGSYKSEWHEET